jgi:hypothetical protein
MPTGAPRIPSRLPEGLPMVSLDVGVGDGAAVGVGVDQQDLAAGGGPLEGEVQVTVVPCASWLSQVVPPALAGGTDGPEGPVRRRRFVEVPAAFGLPLPILRHACRCRAGWPVRPWLCPPEARADSSASISVTEFLSPSGVSQLRCRSRPVTIIGRRPWTRSACACSTRPGVL